MPIQIFKNWAFGLMEGMAEMVRSAVTPGLVISSLGKDMEREPVNLLETHKIIFDSGLWG